MVRNPREAGESEGWEEGYLPSVQELQGFFGNQMVAPAALARLAIHGCSLNGITSE